MVKIKKLIVTLCLVIIVVGTLCAFATSQVNDGGAVPYVISEQPQVYTTNSENIEIGQAADNLSAAKLLDNGIDSQLEVIIPGDLDTGMQWALASLQISELWGIMSGGGDVVVAVLDTGIDTDHEDLAGQVIGEANFTDSLTTDDIYGHGTHIAGIIAARDNDLGIIGIAPGCSLLNVKVADDRGRCDVNSLVEGIVWAVNNGADIINISIEIKESTPDLVEAIQYAWESGALIVAAAGNRGSQEPVYPACYETAISVGAITEDNKLAPLSNYGDWIDLVAPGYNIYSTSPGDTYKYESGTSFAAAHVSGIAALLFNVVVDTNDNRRINDEIQAVVEAGCKDIGITGTGEGLINALDILAQIDQTMVH